MRYKEAYPYFQISKKSRYAIRGLLELALRGDDEPINVRTLSERQQIPARFLEIILNELKQGGFVRSIRGKAGGYLLARSTKEITFGQVIRFLDHHDEPLKETGDTIPRHGDFVLPSILDRINQAVSDVCDETSLQDMVAEHMNSRQAFISNYVI
jgi:Rrf2 family protein